jgi:hypothetical protein
LASGLFVPGFDFGFEGELKKLSMEVWPTLAFELFLGGGVVILRFGGILVGSYV